MKRHPLEVLLPTRGVRMLAVTILAIATIWVSWIMQRLVRGVTPGIVRMEFALTPQRARAIISEWGVGGEARMLAQIGIDNWWLALYSTTLALLCIMVATRVRDRAPRLAELGRALAWAAWGAAILDRLENLALTRSIESGPAWPLTITAAVCAFFKFSVIAMCLLYIIGGEWRARRRAQ